MNETKQKLNVREYWNMFLRRKMFFLIPLIIISIGFSVTSNFLPKMYQAQAVILVEEKNVVNPLLTNLAVSTTVGQRLNALREEILAWPRLFQLVETLGLNKDAKNPLALEALISNIRKNLYLKMMILIIQMSNTVRRNRR